MAYPLSPSDWSHVQSYLAVAETGSLSAAAAELGQSQPTIGRHIKALEEHLGVELFTRHARGLRLTQIGRDVLPSAEMMRSAMTQISLQSEAIADRAEGTVRLTCSMFVAHHILPPIIAKLRASFPQIDLVIQPSDSTENLLFREADIAVRMYRPDQVELVAKQVASMSMGVFAATDYLTRRGAPKSVEDFWHHDVVGYDQSTLILDTMHSLGIPAKATDFAVRCDNHPTYWQLVRAGCGIGFTPLAVGRKDPLVRELSLGVPLPALPIWLTAHQSVRKAPRVDAVWQILGQELAEAVR